MKKKLIFLFTIISPLLNAQTILTPEDAVNIGLKNNFDILVAKNTAAADSIQNTIGEAGMLPNVSLNGSVNVNRSNIHQKYTNGSDITANNVGSNSFAPSVGLTWTIFDGTKMFVSKEKYDQIQQFGDYQFRAQVLNTTSDILLGYYQIVMQKEEMSSTDEIIKYNKKRVEITQVQYDAGEGSKTDLLQAEIDLNVEQENRINVELALDDAKRNLNSLLARDVNTTYEVMDSIPQGTFTDRTQLEQKMIAANPALLAFKTQTEIAQLSLRETTSQYFPKISLTGGYNFSHSENTAGFSLLNQSYGWNSGLTFSMPLYSSGNIKVQAETARINILTSQDQFQQASLNASLSLQNAFAIYDAQNKALEIEMQNEKMARESIQIALDQLQYGKGTALEVAQAQSTLAASLLRYDNLSYEVKSAEINVHLQAADL